MRWSCSPTRDAASRMSGAFGAVRNRWTRLVAGNVGHDHSLARDDDLLFSILVFERDLVV